MHRKSLILDHRSSYLIRYHRDFRQIPDTQEVFLYPESSVSIIVEILQRVAPNENSDAAQSVTFLALSTATNS